MSPPNTLDWRHECLRSGMPAMIRSRAPDQPRAGVSGPLSGLTQTPCRDRADDLGLDTPRFDPYGFDVTRAGRSKKKGFPMKRFEIPRIAHCAEGCSSSS